MRIYQQGWYYSERDLTELANEVRRLVTNTLQQEGFITAEQNADFSARNIVTISQKKWYFPWFRKNKDTNGDLWLFISKLPYPMKDELEEEEK